MLHPRRDQDRPASGPAADIQPYAATRRQQMPGKNTEIVVEYRLALFAREMVRILAERRPFSAKTAGDPQLKVIVRVGGHSGGLLRRSVPIPSVSRFLRQRAIKRFITSAHLLQAVARRHARTPPSAAKTRSFFNER